MRNKAERKKSSAKQEERNKAKANANNKVFKIYPVSHQ